MDKIYNPLFYGAIVILVVFVFHKIYDILPKKVQKILDDIPILLLALFVCWILGYAVELIMLIYGKL